jgi:peptidoglycan/LPS O-acetylase OafA/YrhL
MLMSSGGDPLPVEGSTEAAVGEPMPLSRRRRGTRRLAVLAVLAAGLTMLVVAVLSGADAASVGVTAVTGTFAAGLGAVAVAEVASARLVGILTLLVGLACVISVFVPDAFAGPELARLLAGVVMIVASAALLPREPRVAPAIRI